MPMLVLSCIIYFSLIFLVNAWHLQYNYYINFALCYTLHAGLLTDQERLENTLHIGKNKNPVTITELANRLSADRVARQAPLQDFIKGEHCPPDGQHNPFCQKNEFDNSKFILYQQMNLNVLSAMEPI